MYQSTIPQLLTQLNKYFSFINTLFTYQGKHEYVCQRLRYVSCFQRRRTPFQFASAMSITACQTNHTPNTLYEADLIVGRLSLSECSDLKHCSIYDYRQDRNCVNKSLKYNPVKAVGSYTLRAVKSLCTDLIRYCPCWHRQCLQVLRCQFLSPHPHFPQIYSIIKFCYLQFK